MKWLLHWLRDDPVIAGLLETNKYRYLPGMSTPDYAIIDKAGKARRAEVEAALRRGDERRSQ